MEPTVQFLIRHGYLVLFAFVLAEQMGAPLPALPVLLAAGALARLGKMDYPTVVLLAVAASLVSDVIWYEIGRRRGAVVLGWLCRISIEPDTCVRRTEGVFERHDTRALLVAKFVPGLSTVAPPMAGVLRMSFSRFLIFDTLGALVWVVSLTGLGYLFSQQLERVMVHVSQVGGLLGAIVVVGLAAFVAWKVVNRRRVLGRRVERITVDELKRKLDAGEPVTVIDLRHELELAVEPGSIPGALHLPAEQLDARHAEIPRDREVALVCT